MTRCEARMLTRNYEYEILISSFRRYTTGTIFFYASGNYFHFYKVIGGNFLYNLIYQEEMKVQQQHFQL